MDLPKICVRMTKVEEITIMIVEIAAMVGSIWSRNALNMLRVRVELSPPDTNMATITSSKEVKNASSADVMMENRICGKVTVKNAVNREAPRPRAASSWFSHSFSRPR